MPNFRTSKDKCEYIYVRNKFEILIFIFLLFSNLYKERKVKGTHVYNKGRYSDITFTFKLY